MSKKNLDIIIIGFAIFATFFGAGNLIFPPYLGVLSGEQWYAAFAGFLVGDVILSILAVIVSCKYNSRGIGVLSRVGEKFAVVMGCIMLACIGPLMSIPRTGATTFEISIQPLFPNANPVVFSIIFFAVTLVLTVRPSKVVDNVGKFLTPALLLALAVLIIKGLVTPLGDPNPEPYIDHLFAEGLAQGYQTMDAFGGTVIAIIIMASVISKGYTEEKERISMTGKAGIVAGICLALVYGGLCLVGTTAAVAQFFAGVFHNKIKYEWLVVIFCVFSAVISNFGVNTIIQFSGPILSVIYPIVVAMILLSIFTERIKNDNVFRFAAYMALLISVLTLVGVPGMDRLPLSSFGLNWILPVAIAALIGFFVPSKKRIQTGEEGGN